jgi:uncharacterized protein (TIGR03083 family)
MMPLPPVETIHLFPGEREALLDLLRDLTPDAWSAMTVCDGWNVHDVALHLLGGDIGWLSGGRDGFRGSSTAPAVPDLDDWDTLVGWIDARNAAWVGASRRISPALLVDLLALTGERLAGWIPTIDLDAPGISVAWAGPEPAPAWLHVAREYTERWVHQQHIRDAVSRPGLTGPEWLHPVLATFARALPHTLREHAAPTGHTATLRIIGAAGGTWSVRREHGTWVFLTSPPARPDTVVTMGEETAWRGFTRGIEFEEVRARARVDGDPAIGASILRMVTIIA